MSLGLLAALGAAGAYAAGTVLQARGTRRAAGLRALRQPLVLLGLACDGLGFLLALVAYGRLPLFVAQGVVASSLVGVVLLAVPVLGVRLRHADAAGAGTAVVGLVLLAVSAGEQPAVAPGRGFVVGTLAATLALVLLVVLAYRRGPAWLLGLAAGLGYAGVAVAARGARSHGSLLVLVRQPLAPAVLVCGLVAVVAYVRALERGPVGSAAAWVSVVEVVVPAAVGVLLLGDRVTPGRVPLAVLGSALALTACLVLARSPAQPAT